MASLSSIAWYEGMCPSATYIRKTLCHSRPFAECIVESVIEEERRLFYVAATRAKENLILLKPAIDRSARWMKNYSGGYSGSIFTEVSRFLQEGSILERFMDVEKAGGDFDDVEFEDVI